MKYYVILTYQLNPQTITICAPPNRHHSSNTFSLKKRKIQVLRTQSFTKLLSLNLASFRTLVCFQEIVTKEVRFKVGNRAGQISFCVNK